MKYKADFKTLLLNHYDRYPKMHIQDMVKLIYQNEFAGGHMIISTANSLDRLTEEYHLLKGCSSGCMPLFESVGNNLSRLHLKEISNTQINLTTVNQMFVATANDVHGNKQGFEKKLDILRHCCQQNELPYSIENVDAYLNKLRDQGYPAVSHSDNYRKTYSPAYRIVKTVYQHYFEVFRKIDMLLNIKPVVNVAIEGNSGAGKSTLALLLSQIYDSNVFHMDDFFLTPELKTDERLKEVGGNVDYARFKKEVINGLRSNRKFNYRKYDCKQQEFCETISVLPKRINIIEGSYSLHPTLIDHYDLRIFLRIDPVEQYARILKRNGRFLLQRFLEEWIPLENHYFETTKVFDQCDMLYETNNLYTI